MLYLAKVQKIGETSKFSLDLLLRQKSEVLWALVASSTTMKTPLKVSGDHYPDEGFVLVEVTEAETVECVQDATAWVLMVIEQYLGRGITPNILMEEAERVEEWRQSLTLQSQDVVRRSLEVETRRDQIQELEKGLEEKRIKLDTKREELTTLQNDLEHTRQALEQERAALATERQHIEAEVQSLDAQRQEWQKKQEVLHQELSHLEERKQQLDLDVQKRQNVLELKQ